MFGGAGFAFFAALHYWWPKMFGRMYDFKRAYTGAILLTGGFMFHYVPMFILGLRGMPRQYFDYLPRYEKGNFFAGFGAAFMIIGIFLMVINLLLSLRKERDASSDPWGGTTLEWQTPSPPPLHNFITEPEVPAYPYDFSGVVEKYSKDDKGE
jgi:cytochrome c oxidase subunit 1